MNNQTFSCAAMALLLLGATCGTMASAEKERKTATAGIKDGRGQKAGKCDAPGFTTAGGHFNPANKQHGMQNPEGHHAGDLPNLTVGANGKGAFKTTIQNVTLAGDGATSLFHAGGTSVLIHEKADDMKTDPAGNAGARIACGMIQ